MHGHHNRPQKTCNFTFPIAHGIILEVSSWIINWNQILHFCKGFSIACQERTISPQAGEDSHAIFGSRHGLSHDSPITYFPTSWYYSQTRVVHHYHFSIENSIRTSLLTWRVVKNGDPYRVHALALAMSEQPSSLEDVFALRGVDPSASNNLIQEGWNIETFGLAATDLSGFDLVLDAMFPNTQLTILQKAQLRAAFKKCQQLAEPQPTPVSKQEIPNESTPTNSWSESFAPKLDSQAIHDMKSQFLKNYPSELLNADTTPSARLLPVDG